MNQLNQLDFIKSCESAEDRNIVEWCGMFNIRVPPPVDKSPCLTPESIGASLVIRAVFDQAKRYSEWNGSEDVREYLKARVSEVTERAKSMLGDHYDAWYSWHSMG